MKYQLLIFDFDGTLADSVPWMMSVMDEISDRHRLPRLTDEDKEIIRGPNGGNVSSKLKIPRWKLPLIARDGRRMMTAHLDKIRLFDGTNVLFRRLRDNGVRIAMVSSNSEANVRKVLGDENAALVELFECGASFLGKSRKFRKVIKRTGLPSTSILSVGDEVRDLEASIASGLAFGGVSWGLSTPEAFRTKGATHVFPTMADIVETVLATPA